ncbi:MAG: hypothetical protein JST30_01750 [Armatimonadetes bacterium]|nr:hypothetical protein [Armatimonadota bacterium]
MVTIGASRFIQITASLAKVEQLSRMPTPLQANQIDPAVREMMVKQIGDSVEALDGLGLPMTAMQFKRLLDLVQGNCSYAELGACCGATHERLRDECRLSTWLKLDDERAGHYTNPTAKLDLEPLLTTFPSAVPDLFESSICYALDRGTASVLHSVRSLEIAVRALWSSLGQPNPREPKGWGDYASWAREYIQNPKREPRPPDWPLMRPFYESCDGGLQAVYKAWRCPVVHEPERTYTAGQAKEILEAARGLLGYLSVHLDESGTYSP